MKLEQVKPRNFVAKALRGMSGAGVHEQKRGKKRVKRAKQKQEFRKQLKSLEY